jgi:class 3 adenylate cyclase
MTAHILVVDDEPDIETLVVQKFRREVRAGAMEFCFAGDGVEALAKVGATPDIDVVVTDINMPRMDGLTLLARLAEIDNGPATMVVSAYGDMANIRTAMNRGAFDFVTKPIDFADFETTLHKTLRHVETLREARRRAAAAERAQAALARYFSPALAERLACGDGGAALDGAHRDITAIFTDITGFTSLAESLDIAVLAALLHEYLSGMIDIVFAHDGTVAKIVGDALQILFGAPDPRPDHAARAIACARALDRFAEAQRARWHAAGVALGPTRIGVHSGPAIVGNFGAERFFDYTAYGDTINTAARLETANKRLGTRVCVSASSAGAAPEGMRPVGNLVLRGRTGDLRAYDATEPPAGYSDAFALLERAAPEALAAFAALVGHHPDDALAHFHLRRLLDGAKGPRIDLGQE